MERLTFDGNFCDIVQCRENPCPNNNSCPAREVWERLKQYEDTGLTPEEIDMDHEAAEQLRGLCQGCDLDRLDELARADREGCVRIMPNDANGTCGSCENFCRIPDTARGACKIHKYYRNRHGQIEEYRGAFITFQSRKSCKQYKPREEAEEALGAMSDGNQ